MYRKTKDKEYQFKFLDCEAITDSRALSMGIVLLVLVPAFYGGLGALVGFLLMLTLGVFGVGVGFLAMWVATISGLVVRFILNSTFQRPKRGE